MSIKKGIFLVLPIFALTLAGCANMGAEIHNTLSDSHVMSTSGKTYPATNPAKVKLYFSQKPSRKYVEIGQISVDTYNMVGMTRGEQQIKQDFQQAAAKLGGNAVINIRTTLGKKTGTVVRFRK